MKSPSLSRGAWAVIVLFGLMIVGTTIAILTPQTSSNDVAPHLNEHVRGYSMPPLPSLDTGAKNEVRVTNPNGFLVEVELRSGSTDKTFDVAAQSEESVDVPNGTYDAFFRYSTQPGALYQGDSFSLNNNGVEIKIVKVVGGNYGIRRLK